MTRHVGANRDGLREAVNESLDNKRPGRDEWRAYGIRLSRDDGITGAANQLQRVKYKRDHLFLISIAYTICLGKN